METQMKIHLKQAILLFPNVAKQLKRESKTFDTAIIEFAELTNTQPIFLKQNIDLIRNWI